MIERSAARRLCMARRNERHCRCRNERYHQT
jgi:hypothetical protein